MTNTHSENPFGINYKATEQHSKVYKKFNQIDKYVMMSK